MPRQRNRTAPSRTSSRSSCRLGQREHTAQQTRHGILEAAERVLACSGMHGFSLERVASEAGVSRVTVYSHFQSRSGLLEALVWSTFEQHDISKMRDARLQPDVRAALVDFVRENARFFSSFGVSGRAAFLAAASDPDARHVVETTYFAARRAAIKELVDRLVQEGHLGPGWVAARAVDVVMVVTSVEAFETLTVHGALPLEEAADVLARMAAVVLKSRFDTAETPQQRSPS